MSDFAGRVTYCIDLIGGRAAAAKATGISTASLHKYMSGASEPSRDRLVAIAEAADVNITWLAQGRGDPSGQTSEWETVPRYDLSLSAGGGTSVLDERDIIEQVPFLASHLDRLGLRTVRDLMILSVAGDSMEPTASDGSTVLVDRSDTEILPGVYAIIINERAHIKRLRMRITGELDIISDNQKYETETLIGEQLNLVTVLGRVRLISNWL